MGANITYVPEASESGSKTYFCTSFQGLKLRVTRISDEGVVMRSSYNYILMGLLGRRIGKYEDTDTHINVGIIYLLNNKTNP